MFNRFSSFKSSTMIKKRFCRSSTPFYHRIISMRSPNYSSRSFPSNHPNTFWRKTNAERLFLHRHFLLRQKSRYASDSIIDELLRPTFIAAWDQNLLRLSSRWTPQIPPSRERRRLIRSAKFICRTRIDSFKTTSRNLWNLFLPWLISRRLTWLLRSRHFRRFVRFPSRVILLRAFFVLCWMNAWACQQISTIASKIFASAVYVRMDTDLNRCTPLNNGIGWTFCRPLKICSSWTRKSSNGTKYFE